MPQELAKGKQKVSRGADQVEQCGGRRSYRVCLGRTEDGYQEIFLNCTQHYELGQRPAGSACKS